MAIYSHDLEYLGIKAYDAVNSCVGTTKGQLEAFEGFGLTDTITTPRAKLKNLELNGRYVSRDTDPVYASETRNCKSPRPMIDPHAFEMSSWRRAINALSDEQRSWIMYKYGNDLNFEHQVNICKYVWGEFERYAMKFSLSKKVKDRLKSLIWLSVQQSQGVGYIQAKLAELISVSRYNWNKTYHGHWQQMMYISDELDELALIAMRNKRQEQRSKNEV
ncbi:bacteriophage antitermination protein Q [Moellerella wisconsensis]|uniref:bacteriophage antitermination protein Q n=1 Tax=Moellerella wisconsensis TaxID=158849 RepID=UPI001F4DF47B|nr:bacteriophage antitermination protein Q [Moellerella wisconsensis]UNH28355.1 bacteriophage antitermination protein Q [Moellerella wisconsensis]